MYEFHSGLDRTVMIYVYEPLLQSNFSVGLILGRSFLAWGIWRDVVCLTASLKNGAKFSFRIWNSARLGIFWYAIGAFFAGIFFSISPHINFGWSRYLALYL